MKNIRNSQCLSMSKDASAIIIIVLASGPIGSQFVASSANFPQTTMVNIDCSVVWKVTGSLCWWVRSVDLELHMRTSVV